jgi:putative SOS response-associated peptidase YedK
MFGEAIRNRRDDLRARHNIASTHSVPIIRRRAAGLLELVDTRWGPLRFWAKQPTISYNTINARAETMERPAALRTPFKRRRYLVPATGWYE